MVHIEDVAYEVDGNGMLGHLAYDESRPGQRAAVLLCHEGPGLDEHVKSRAERLAELGYVAFALDYHGRGMPLPLEEGERPSRVLVRQCGRLSSLVEIGRCLIVSVN